MTVEPGISISHEQTTLFVDYSTNTTNNLFVDPQKNLFVAICGYLWTFIIDTNLSL